MEDYFSLLADPTPNGKEIHLDPINKKEIYEEYEQDMNDIFEEPLSSTTFLKVWNDAFPHVKIREYKQVSFLLVKT